MYSAAIPRPAEGVPRPCSASDARKETSAFRPLAVSREVISPVCAAAAATAMAAKTAVSGLSILLMMRMVSRPFHVDRAPALPCAAAARHAFDLIRKEV